MRYWGVLLVFLFGCNSKNTELPPADLIEKDLLIETIIDLEIMEAYYEQVHKRPKVYRKTLDSASNQILREKGLDKNQMESTLAYYSNTPDSLYQLYEAALDTINNMVNFNKNKNQ
ncbi:hypothetical protein DNU06_05095 [Putridiphycobacter roseus]|uniref:DUF4296 domain-containing protein n=1 Tax=Putridiphycobacter roseus TaxID=2219161 RepID=A0A2W1N156_9FLAO|nr:DUF4296 domain-containing protein [Putridiphycobacter roseus]PZE17997.1 hypothetical protein DNU06_05095 [Putridiphycobacter roseus]